MSRGTLLVLVALAVASVAPAGARAQATPADARLEGRFDAATGAAVRAAIDSARAAGLPVEPLVQRALQGATKGASRERILAAVARLRGELTTARQALGSRSTTAELEAGASALRAGAAAADLARLRADRPARALTVALGTLADLVAQGVPVATAVEVTTALWDRDVPDEELIAVRRDVARDVAAGATPGAAAVVRARGPSGLRGPAARPPRGRGQGGKPDTKPSRP